MKNYYINPQDERIVHLTNSMNRLRSILSILQGKVKKTPFQNEVYITDRELSERLKVCRRTLHEWRNKGKISYISICGKILYKESEVQAMLDRHHYDAL